MRKKKIKFLIVIVIVNFSCARFRVEKLQNEELFSIPINENINSLSFPEQKGLFHEIPSRMGIYENKLIVSEPSNRQIKIFNKNKLELIIASKEYQKIKVTQQEIKNKELKTQPKTEKPVKTILADNLSIPGMIIAGQDEDFYVVSYFSEKEMPKNIQNEKAENIDQKNNDEEESDNQIDSQKSTGFYKILHFNIKGELLGIIGRQGKTEDHFENILWMDVDSDRGFWVTYSYAEEVYLERYVDNMLRETFTKNMCRDIVFSTISKSQDYIYSCENMFPFSNAEKVIFVGRVDKIPDRSEVNSQGLIFQKRIFLIRDLATQENKIIFNNLNDPEDYPYIPYDKNISLWQFKDHSTTKISLYSLEGDLLKNLQIELPGNRHAWRSTYLTLSGFFYSIRIQKNNLMIYRWK
ncbi:MAG: hypothetical protein OEZ22_10650 [Spirochaetia bacterium]|nr:hypothetical protein [Spirochaetia bacterium]